MSKLAKFNKLRDRFNADAILVVSVDQLNLIVNAKPYTNSLYVDKIMLPSIKGRIYSDKHERFDHGEVVRTSYVLQVTQVDCIDIYVVKTRNTTYVVITKDS